MVCVCDCVGEICCTDVAESKQSGWIACERVTGYFEIDCTEMVHMIAESENNLINI